VTSNINVDPFAILRVELPVIHGIPSLDVAFALRLRYQLLAAPHPTYLVLQLPYVMAMEYTVFQLLKYRDERNRGRMGDKAAERDEDRSMEIMNQCVESVVLAAMKSRR